MPGRPYFPMFVDLTDQKVIIVGAGTIAKRRIRTIIEFCDDVTVIAPEVNPELNMLEKEGRIKILRKNYEREDIYGADIVIAATNHAAVNSDIYAACKTLGIRVNVCSDKTKCDFYFPGIIRKDDVVIGISSSGRDPKSSRRVREQIGACLDGEYETGR